jgi:hypothetical protein
MLARIVLGIGLSTRVFFPGTGHMCRAVCLPVTVYLMI